ncbi:MAG: cysteine--tRNA ligase [Chloroflexota bacterium]|nr:cysteine--tRNA ligase [Chloroflexota bacterium]
MSVHIHNTLTGREEDIVPVNSDGVLRMYVCGMTPKYHPHLGHARLFVAMDLIRRYLTFRGYALKFVQNFTDVDDKIIQRAASEGRTADATANAYMKSYYEVMDRLSVRRADAYPTVTGSMERIVEFIAGLAETDHAYATDSGDVYFAVSSFPDYGKLSHRDVNSQLVAARKELEPGKRDPRDFALWKRSRPGEPSWPSPWGRGRPGWHIECSAMVRETLDDQIDIHGGGADLIFPHHENEIAQSESLTGKVPFTQYWAHAGLVILGGGEKMAHSAGNFTTLAAVLEKYEPIEVRYYLLATHYRSSLTFTVEGEDAADRRVRGIEDARGALARLRRALGDEPLDQDGALHEPAVEAFKGAMDADFNTPDALSVIFDLAREINTLRSGLAERQDIDSRRRTLVYLLDVLGLDLAATSLRHEVAVEPFVELLDKIRAQAAVVLAGPSVQAPGTLTREAPALATVVDQLLDSRRKLRAARRFDLADEVRARLIQLGVTVEDKPGGVSTWRVER